jgi:hypothetical protein
MPITADDRLSAAITEAQPHEPRRTRDPGWLQPPGRGHEVLLSALMVALPFALYLGHLLLFGTWIIDDAGISFAYSRNLAHGYGLVAQPGTVPVEGFSNLTWVILLAPFLALHVFDPIVTPKVIAALCTLSAFLFLRATLKHLTRHPRAATLFTLSLLAGNTAFVVWTSSGLENGLNVLLSCALLWLLVRSVSSGAVRPRSAAAAGLLTTLLALTRPDGVLYACVLPALLVFDWIRGRRTYRPAPAFLAFAGVFITTFGAFLTFRRLYFGDFLPNTYYAKDGLETAAILSPLNPKMWGKLIWLSSSILTHFGPVAFAALTGGMAWLLMTRGRERQRLTIFLFVAISSVTFLLLPVDLMTEFRFATPFYAPAYVLLFLVGEAALQAADDVCRKLRPPRTGRWIAVGLVTAFCALSLATFAERTRRFRANPSIPFTMVAERYGRQFNRLAAAMKVTNGSLLLPDMGGTLYYSDLRLYDLAGLTDRTIARTLRHDHRRFYDYVFEEVKPTFIHTHGMWASLADFDADPRFRRDYVPIREGEDIVAERLHERPILAGDYIRKEVAEGNPNLGGGGAGTR